MENPQAYTTSVIFIFLVAKRVAACFRRMLRMKSWGVCPVSSFIFRCR